MYGTSRYTANTKNVQQDTAYTYTHTHTGGGWGGGILFAHLKKCVFTAIEHEKSHLRSAQKAYCTSGYLVDTAFTVFKGGFAIQEFQKRGKGGCSLFCKTPCLRKKNSWYLNLKQE